MKCKNCGRSDVPDGAGWCCWCGKKLIKTRKKSTELKVPTPKQVSSGKWFIRLRIDGKNINITEPTKRECIEKARAIKAGLISEKPKEDTRNVGQLVDEYIEKREGIRSPSTIDGYLRKRKNNLQSLMELKVSELTLDTVQTAISDEAKKYSGKTIKDAWSLISAATGVCFQDNELILPSAKPKKKPPVYESDDLFRLIIALGQIGGEVECAGLLALWLSLRRSEIKGLEWNDIRKDSIRVCNAMVYDKHHKLVEKETKTEKSERIIPCNAYILDRINALPRDGEKVFQLSTSALWEGITLACNLAGIEHGYLHGLRHSNASVMALVGVDTKYAMKRGGWSTETTMRNVYQDIMKEGELKAAESVDRYFLELLGSKKKTENVQNGN